VSSTIIKDFEHFYFLFKGCGSIACEESTILHLLEYSELGMGAESDAKL